MRETLTPIGALAAMTAGGLGTPRHTTISHTYLEWIIAPGDRLTVVGTVAAPDGIPLLTGYADQPVLVTSLPLAEVTGRTRRRMRLATAAGIAAIVLAVLLLVGWVWLLFRGWLGH